MRFLLAAALGALCARMAYRHHGKAGEGKCLVCDQPWRQW